MIAAGVRQVEIDVGVAEAVGDVMVFHRSDDADARYRLFDRKAITNIADGCHPSGACETSAEQLFLIE
jgi:hypothetical protein